MKLVRLKTGAKAKRWAKGGSGKSNPDSKKNRDKARSKMTSMAKLDNEFLTRDAMREHDQAARTVPYAASALSAYGGRAPTVFSFGGDGEEGMGKAPTELRLSFKRPATVKSVYNLERDMKAMSVVAEDDLQSQAKTFASHHTTASIPCFEKMFEKMVVQDHSLHLSIVGFHEGVNAYIREHNLKQTPITYLLSITHHLKAFESSKSEDTEQVCAGLCMLAKVIKHVPRDTLVNQCINLGGVLYNILVLHADSTAARLLDYAFGCLSVVLRAQRYDRWLDQDQLLLTWLKNILVFTQHKDPKVRKSAAYNVRTSLRGAYFMKTCMTSRARQETEEKDNEDDMEVEDAEDLDEKRQIEAEALKTEDLHPASDLVGDFVIQKLQDVKKNKVNSKSAVHTIVFVRQIIMCVSSSKLKLLLVALFRLVSLGNRIINGMVLRAMTELCAANPPECILPLKLTKTIYNTLLSPGSGSTAAIKASPQEPEMVDPWCCALTAALSHVLRCDLGEGLLLAAKWFGYKVLKPYWFSANPKTMARMEEAIEMVVEAIATELQTRQELEQESEDRELVLRQISELMKHLEEGLTFECKSAWRNIVSLLGTCFERIGPIYPEAMTPAIKRLCVVMLMADTTTEIEKKVFDHSIPTAIGKAVRGLGVQALLDHAPIKITGNFDSDQVNWWILPTVAKYVRGTQLSLFYEKFHPLTKKCSSILAKLRKADSKPQVIRLYEQVEHQIWSLLFSFARDATDVEAAQANKDFARMVHSIINERKSYCLFAIKALQEMIKADAEPVDDSPSRLSKNADKYVAVLTDYYTDHRDDKNDSSSKEAFKTIRAFLVVSQSKFRAKYTQRVLDQYKASTVKERNDAGVKLYKDPDVENDAVKEARPEDVLTKDEDIKRKTALLNLMRLLLPYCDESGVGVLVDIAIHDICVEKNHVKQKAAYRLLEDLLESEDENVQTYLKNNLLRISNKLVKAGRTNTAETSRESRLWCVKAVVLASPRMMDTQVRREVVTAAVAEAVLCIGRAHTKRVRQGAAEVLAVLIDDVLMKTCSGEMDDDADMRDSCLRDAMKMIAVGLKGSPLTQANTVNATTMFTYYNKDMPVDVLRDNLNNISLLISSADRDVAQSCLSFVKSLVSLYSALILRPLLRTVVDCILSIEKFCAKKLRTKIDSILTRLIKKFGGEAMTEMIPARQTIMLKRMRNLRKAVAREKRKREEQDKEDPEGSEEGQDEGSAPMSIENILATIDDDDREEEDDDLEDVKSTGAGRGVWLEEGDDPYDMLSQDASASLKSSKPKVMKDLSEAPEKEKEVNGGFEMTADGKLLITEESREEKIVKKPSRELEETLAMQAQAQTGKITSKRTRETPVSDEDSDEEGTVNTARTSKSRQSRGPAKRARVDYGSEYRSGKAGGDVMRSGQQRPHAYVPMRRDVLNPRNKAKNKGQFRTLVRGVRRGVADGKKSRKSGKKEDNRRM